jgi:hypothetical protein
VSTCLEHTTAPNSARMNPILHRRMWRYREDGGLAQGHPLMHNEAGTWANALCYAASRNTWHSEITAHPALSAESKLLVSQAQDFSS